MVELPLGIGLVMWAIVVQLILWRTYMPAHHRRGLLRLFALPPGAALGLVVALQPPWLPEDGLGWLRWALLYVPAALAYIVCYSAIEQESATLTLASRLGAAGE